MLPQQAHIKIKDLLADRDIVTGEDALNFAHDESRAGYGHPACVLFPRTHEQVVDIVKWGHEFDLAIVPSGGRTGLSGGACAAEGDVILSLEKQNQLVSFDDIEGLITVQAGMTIESLQNLAIEKGWMYPVDYASKGSAQVGGGVATNAGGMRVLRYGMTRQWVAGLKAVLANGETLDLSRNLLKDNSGYDLKNLLIGSEGTLAVITEVSMRLASPLSDQLTLIGGFSSLDQLVSKFSELHRKYSLSAAEFFCEKSYAKVIATHGLPELFEGKGFRFYLLIEMDEHSVELEELAAALDGIDVAFAQTSEQSKRLWQYREMISSTINPSRPYKNDIACGLSRLPQWIGEIESRLLSLSSNIEVLLFGHIGDGNIHLNILSKGSSEGLDSITPAIDDIIIDASNLFNASISAEHGIGLLKRSMLEATSSTAELDCQRAVKFALDKVNSLNRGKVLSPLKVG